MDVQTIDNQYAQLQQQSQSTVQALQTLGNKLQSAAGNADTQAREWLRDLRERALSFRAWNGQLRQPLYLLWPGAVVGTAPVEGFLHRTTELDTLGLDRPESACKTFGG